MKVIGSGFDTHADNRAGRPAELCRERVGLNSEFLRGIDRRNKRRRVHLRQIQGQVLPPSRNWRSPSPPFEEKLFSEPFLPPKPP